MNLTIKTIIILTILFSLSSCDLNTQGDKSESKKNAISQSNESTNNEVNNTSKANNTPMNDTFTFVGDTVLIPTFEIEIQLTESAEKKIQGDKESIIVQAYFSGIPQDTTLEDYKEWGKIRIGSHRIELTKYRVARFENVKISKTEFDELGDKNFEVLINVVTGRKASMNNLIDCEILQDGIETVKAKRHI